MDRRPCVRTPFVVQEIKKPDLIYVMPQREFILCQNILTLNIIMFNPHADFLRAQKLNSLVHIYAKSSGSFSTAIKWWYQEPISSPFLLALFPLCWLRPPRSGPRSSWLILYLELTNLQFRILESSPPPFLLHPISICPSGSPLRAYPRFCHFSSSPTCVSHDHLSPRLFS